MCGIIGYTGKNKAVPYLLKGLEHLQYRGYDSSGIALFENNKIVTVKSEGKIRELKMKLHGFESDSKSGIGHTRWATHGEPSDINSHPHSSMNGKFTVVHNGIIENYLSLKKELMREGYSFISQTDTEVIANILEKYYSGDIMYAIERCRSVLIGSFALGIMCSDFPQTIYALRKASPLICAKSEEGSFIASDITALLPYTKYVYTLKEDETAVIGKDKLSFYDLDGKSVNKEAEEILWSNNSADKGDFEHYMLKEISEQPQVLKDTIDFFTEKGELLSQIDKLRKSFFTLERIYFIGCGSAYHVGLAGKIIIQRLSNITCSVQRASEFRYGWEPVDSKTLCVFISQSGETADTLAALVKAKEKKAKILSVINVPGSSMARESDNVLYTRAGAEIAVATTKAYTAQLAAVYLFAVSIAHERWQIKRNEMKRLIDEITALPEKVEKIISQKEKLEELSRFFDGWNHGYFIGRGNDYAAAVEGSLKMKEISYINTQAYPAGELKHGTISLIEKGTPVVALCCEDRLFRKTLSNIKEVKARGARVLVFASEKHRTELTDEENVFFLPDVSDELSCLCQVVALQLLSYYTARGRGCDIDKPKNLAKSVTVE